MAWGLRAGMDQLPDLPAALHRRRQVVDLVTGATATFASTSTTHWPSHTDSKTYWPKSTATPHASSWGWPPPAPATRRLTGAQCLSSGGATYLRHGGASLGW